MNRSVIWRKSPFTAHCSLLTAHCSLLTASKGAQPRGRGEDEDEEEEEIRQGDCFKDLMFVCDQNLAGPDQEERSA